MVLLQDLSVSLEMAAILSVGQLVKKDIIKLLKCKSLFFFINICSMLCSITSALPVDVYRLLNTRITTFFLVMYKLSL